MQGVGLEKEFFCSMIAKVCVHLTVTLISGSVLNCFHKGERTQLDGFNVNGLALLVSFTGTKSSRDQIFPSMTMLL